MTAFKPDPANDPNDAYEVVNTPAELRGPPTDWWTVLANGVPVYHFASHKKYLPTPLIGWRKSRRRNNGRKSRHEPGCLLMLVYVARHCDTAIEADVEDLGCGAGRIKCPKCRGTGKTLWPIEVTGLDEKCIDCKGTGSQLVSI